MHTTPIIAMHLCHIYNGSTCMHATSIIVCMHATANIGQLRMIYTMVWEVIWKFAIDKYKSTLIISKSKGLSKILQDIRTSTYQICRIEEKIHQATKFHKRICYLTPEVRYI